MKFHLKITFIMLALVSILFGIGESVLLSSSFNDSLEREQEATLSEYRMALGMLQIVDDVSVNIDKDALSKTMEQIHRQSGMYWAELCLSASDEVIYSNSNEQNADFSFENLNDIPEPNSCLVHIIQTPNGERYLTLSGAVKMDGEVLYLKAVRNISEIYTLRNHQREICFRVFLMVCLLCGILAYTISKIIMNPLKELSMASKTIASGDYGKRVKIHSEDEIGKLSEDFNMMAKQLEIDAEQKKEYISELQKYAERQEQFIGSFAHEMKNPMTALIGYADLIRSGTLTKEEEIEAAGYIYSESKRLESLSQKLLEVLVVRNQELPLVMTSPKELTERLVNRLKPIYAQNGIDIVCSCEEGECMLEPDLVWSLLLNLADNAKKSMENGGELRFDLNMTDNGCKICVTDNGGGIPEEAVEHLTEAFYRVDKARSRKQGGFGLGLHLCQEIVLIHKGNLNFINRPEGGTCVEVELRGGRALQ